jgi:hypothetical protein
MASAMSIRSGRGVALGGFIALGVPVSFWLLAALVAGGIAPYDQVRSALDVIGLLGWASLFVLGPAGILIAGKSAGVSNAASWIALMVVAVPVFVILWFVGVATLSGTLGNPF